MKIVRMDRQPNGDECGAYYFDDGTGPHYIRDSKVELFEKDLLAETSLLLAKKRSAEFLAKWGYSVDEATAVLFVYRQWQRQIIERARQSVSDAIVSLNQSGQVRLAESMQLLASAWVPQ